jgi:hypothetical protein
MGVPQKMLDWFHQNLLFGERPSESEIPTEFSLSLSLSLSLSPQTQLLKQNIPSCRFLALTSLTFFEYSLMTMLLIQLFKLRR